MTSSPASTDALLEGGFRAAVAAADPAATLAPHWPSPPRGRLIVLALGKAAGAMAGAAVERYASSGTSLEGLVVAPHGGVTEVPGLTCLEAGHPVPDAASERAGRALLARAEAADEDDLVLLLISGGGSALAVVPDGPSLAQLAGAHAALVRAGVPIEDVNRVRRRVDRLKGGGLAAAAFPARTLALAVSDVVGDDPLAIASGPASGDPHGPEDALAVLDRHALALPPIRARLDAERDGARAGPPTPDDPRLARTEVRIVASAADALAAARAHFERAGYHARVTSDAVSGDAREAARRQADEVAGLLREGRLADGSRAALPAALLSGGETTVAVRGSGSGGRNSTFALAFALALPEGAPLHALIADSDGIDGVGGHAGAFVRPSFFARVSRRRAEQLDRNDDSRRAFAEADALFEPGPTGTNVNDLRFVLVGEPPADETA